MVAKADSKQLETIRDGDVQPRRLEQIGGCDCLFLQFEDELERILERRRRGRGVQYLVRWKGYGREDDEWLPGAECADLEALDVFLHENALPEE